mmetsp:Transcript_25757/g.29441  ORF Transcript_25757/g.29441 Transcript_25757/m.29441 type:complete len:275 (+) Transcript_25757:44-868(+)
MTGESPESDQQLDISKNDVSSFIEEKYIDQSRNVNNNGGKISTKRRKSKRHGARNQHRHKYFCKWIMENFNLKEGDLILDIAGGKGELAARLSICHKLNVLMVDPRPADIQKTFESLVLPKLPKRHQLRMTERQKVEPTFLKTVFQERFRQIETLFDEYLIDTNEEVREALEKCSLIIGLHADGATESIVNVALEHNKPFVVVPCCVFPNLFNQRFLYNQYNNMDSSSSSNKPIPVRTHEQFCQYLLAKDECLQHCTLPFEGRNFAIYWTQNQM